jgi:hypothetical protein
MMARASSVLKSVIADFAFFAKAAPTAPPIAPMACPQPGTTLPAAIPYFAAFPATLGEPSRRRS